MRPDPGRQIEEVLSAVRRRLAMRSALEAVMTGAAGAAVIALVLRWIGAGTWWTLGAMVGAAMAVGGLWFAIAPGKRTRAAAARAIERARPDCRNVVITAEEILRDRSRIQPWIGERVFADAVSHAAAVDPSAAVGLRFLAAGTAVAVAVALAVALIAPQRRASHIREAAAGSGSATAAVRPLSFTATLDPPTYVGGQPLTFTDPERLTALEGSRLHLRIAGEQWRVRFGNAPVPLRVGQGAAAADLLLEDSGYFAIEPLGHTGGAARLLPVLVTADGVPVVRVEKPGRDLLLSSARAVSVLATASDDYGLRAMSLRYTRVSGSGEQFEFVEGEWPIDITREGSRTWRGRGEVPLARLGLGPGDSLVYRIIARDGREGVAGFGSSDTFFIEIAGRGEVAIEGFEMPPDRDRYALSQQMIVLKIERLRAREAGLARGARQEQAAAIAAEQRAVRANFIFLMGGHVEDEEEEAEQAHEIQEGRLENTARREVSRAVGHMTYAEQSLVAAETRAALREARLAVDALQRAFGRNRYFLRTLPVRSRIDPSRRLSGNLDDAAGWRRDVARPTDDPGRAATHEIMRRLVALAPRIGSGSSGLAAELTAAAETAIHVDPADPEWQQISARILSLRDASASNASREEIDRRLHEAFDSVIAQARRRAVPARTDLPRSGGLRSAWGAEMRR